MAKKKRFDINGIKRDNNFNVTFTKEIQKYLETHSINENEKHFYENIHSFICMTYGKYEREILDYYSDLTRPKGKMHYHEKQSMLLGCCKKFLSLNIDEWRNYKGQTCGIFEPKPKKIVLTMTVYFG